MVPMLPKNNSPRRWALMLLLAAAASGGAEVHPCAGGAAILDGNGSACEVLTNRTVDLRTRWQVASAAGSAVPLAVNVANILSFPLDGCGNHTTRIEGGLVTVGVRGFVCPVAPGDHSLDLRVDLPGFVPHGTYSIEIDGSPLLCAAVEVDL